MIRITANDFGWIADASGEALTIRTNRAREIADAVSDGKKYIIEIRRHSNRRSNPQNNMYWSILTQIAEKLQISNARMHNLMIQRYGVPRTYADRICEIHLPDTDGVEEDVMEDLKNHLKPTSAVEIRDGAVFRIYHMMKGTSEMTVEEMKRMIDGLFDEARNLGIVLIWEE